jgi:lipoprotein-anchoring transpeptidase ErfK/SrfK
MQRHVFAALVMSAIGIVSVQADPLSLQPDRYPQTNARPVYATGAIASPARPAPAAAERVPEVQVAAAQSDVNLGGGFIEFLFGGGRAVAPPRPPSEVASRVEPPDQQLAMTVDPRLNVDPKYQKQMVDYRGSEPPGTIIIDTPNRFLFLVQDNGRAMRYGIGVGKPGFTWAGEKKITAKKEWPDWTPPPEMLERRPDLPHFMAGGPENPLGARAMYLGSSLYRIHGSNEPWTIGQAVSSGCIRMRNEDVIDLYEKVKVGTKVVVI